VFGEAVRLGISSSLTPPMASPSPREILATRSGSSKKVGAFTKAVRWAGLPGVKIPSL
jgi:hypothetical protein